MIPCMLLKCLIKKSGKNAPYIRSTLMGLMLCTVISLTCAVSALVCVIYENGKDKNIKPMDVMCNVILIAICFFLFVTELPIRALDSIAATYYPMFSYKKGNFYATGLCQIALLFFILEGLDESQNTKAMLGGHYRRLYWAGGIIIGTSGFLNIVAAIMLSNGDDGKTAKQSRFPGLWKDKPQNDAEALSFPAKDEKNATSKNSVRRNSEASSLRTTIETGSAYSQSTYSQQTVEGPLNTGTEPRLPKEHVFESKAKQLQQPPLGYNGTQNATLPYRYGESTQQLQQPEQSQQTNYQSGYPYQINPLQINRGQRPFARPPPARTSSNPSTRTSSSSVYPRSRAEPYAARVSGQRSVQRRK